MQGCEKPFMWPQEDSAEAGLCGGKSGSKAKTGIQPVRGTR